MAALADGFSGALLPALKGGVTWIKSTTIAQKAMNIAMRANPIGIVVTVLALLVGAFILAYKKSETFRNIVNGALNGVKNVAIAVVGWIKGNFPKILGFMLAPFALVIKPIIKHKDQILAVIKAIPGAIGKFMSNVGSIISAPFRAAFDGIRNAWNNTVGGKGFSVPGWVPGIGGNSFTIPRFHTGGIVSGAMGSESLNILRAGERVTAGSNSDGGAVVTFRADGQYAKQLLAMLKDQIRIDGGAKVVFEL